MLLNLLEPQVTEMDLKTPPNYSMHIFRRVKPSPEAVAYPTPEMGITNSQCFHLVEIQFQVIEPHLAH